MAEHLTVKVADLRTALGRVLDATEAQLGPEVSLAADHYWHLPVENAFDLARQPETFSVGQLSDDLDSLQGQADAPRETVWHDLSHFDRVAPSRGVDSPTLTHAHRYDRAAPGAD